MKFNKKYICTDEKGRVKILTSTINGSEVCFTDGREYFYLDYSDYQYGDNIVSYTPYGWKESIVPHILMFLAISLLWFLIGYNCGILN